MTATTAVKKKSTKEKPLGKVTHFYDKINVAAILLEKGLKVGDKIKIGKNENFLEQEITSLQREHAAVKAAKKGQEVGLKVAERVREGDLVWKA